MTDYTVAATGIDVKRPVPTHMYRHYKHGHIYRVRSISRHSETLEYIVNYNRVLYFMPMHNEGYKMDFSHRLPCSLIIKENNGLFVLHEDEWSRPLDMWFGQVIYEISGEDVPRSHPRFVNVTFAEVAEELKALKGSLWSNLDKPPE